MGISERAWRAVVALGMSAVCAAAGVDIRTSFSAADSLVHVEGTDTLRLSVKGYRNVKLLDDALLATGGHAARSCAVMGHSTGTFSVFLSESLTVNHDRLLQRTLVPGAADVAVGAPVLLDNQGRRTTSGVHAAAGENAFLVTFLDNATSGVVRANHQPLAGRSISGNENYPLGSVCHLAADTFLVTFRDDRTLSRLYLRKVTVQGQAIDTVATRIVATGTRTITVDNDDRIASSSLAADQNGVILVLFTRGRSHLTKTLSYALLDKTLSVPFLDTGTVAVGISSASLSYPWDDAPVVSYAPGRFGAASWDETGILFHHFVWDGSSLAIESTRLVERAGCRFATVTANDSFMVVAWKGDFLSPGLPGIEGMVFELARGSPPGSVTDTLRFSRPDRPVTMEMPQGRGIEVGAALDPWGNSAVTWMSGDTAWATVYANRPVYHPSGSWYSPVVPLGVAYGDSVRFYPAQLGPGQGEGFATVYVQAAADSALVRSSEWFALNDPGALHAHGRGLFSHFRYRLAIERSADDSLATPFISEVRIPWNSRPRLVALDSVRVGAVVHAPLFDDTLRIWSRRDSLSLYVRTRDSDTADEVTVQMSALRDATVLHGGAVETQTLFVAAAPQRSDTVVAASFTVQDQHGWKDGPRSVYFATRNDLPRVSVLVAVRDTLTGMPDTVEVDDDAVFVVQETDSLQFFYSYDDRNDPDSLLRVQLLSPGAQEQIDSVPAGGSGRFVFSAGSQRLAGLRTLTFTARDPDTTVTVRVRFGINHFPVIDSVAYRGESFAAGDSLRFVIGRQEQVVITVDDPDVAAGTDTLTIVWQVGGRRDSLATAALVAALPVIALPGDSVLNIWVRDQFGFADSAGLHLRYSWLLLDTLENPVYAAAVAALDSGFKLVVGGQRTDTLRVPLHNIGNDTISVVEVALAHAFGGWLRLGIPRNGEVRESDGVAPTGISPLTIAAGSVETLFVYGSTGLFTGDGLAHDTIIILTSDPVHGVHRVPVRMEYNQLPVITGAGAAFAPHLPHWLAKRRSGDDPLYHFPPHASIAVEFSKPVDTASARSALTLYTAVDSASGVPVPEAVSLRWDEGWQRVLIAPAGGRGGRGMFFPGDSVMVRVTSALTDTARTPSGPNNLDVNYSYVKGEEGDTLLGFRVDAVGFALLSVSPAPDTDTVSPRPCVELTFSSAVYPGTIDTLLQGNASLIMTSTYSGGEAVSFDSIRVEGAVARFYPAPRFWGGDRIDCRYRAVTGRDMLGYPVAMNGGGIPATLFDSLATQDDVQWSFRIRPVRVRAVSPDSAASQADVRPTIQLFFSDPVPAGSLDTASGSSNRSFSIRSAYSGGAAAVIRSVALAPDSMRVSLTLQHALYSDDSVSCRFTGFARDLRYGSFDNLPRDEGVVEGSYSWWFTTGNEGFYTFPNPYKPRFEPRHCSGSDPLSPCGIWFKNLHVLDRSKKGVRIVIYTMHTEPVFDTRAEGIALSWESGLSRQRPDWKWDTRNSLGNEVASGIYPYAVLDAGDRVVHRGKLMIVR